MKLSWISIFSNCLGLSTMLLGALLRLLLSVTYEVPRCQNFNEVQILFVKGLFRKQACVSDQHWPDNHNLCFTSMQEPKPDTPLLTWVPHRSGPACIKLQDKLIRLKELLQRHGFILSPRKGFGLSTNQGLLLFQELGKNFDSTVSPLMQPSWIRFSGCMKTRHVPKGPPLHRDLI